VDHPTAAQHNCERHIIGVMLGQT